MFTGFDVGFGLFEVMFVIIFIIVVGVIIASAVRGIGTWNQNNHSPRLTVPAVVAAKRSDVSYYHHGDMDYGTHTTSSTSYYVTFQVESGDRMEFRVSGHEYGMLVEGDKGRLSFQGTRYLSFERENAAEPSL